jgi:Xaa-Pro aminopeptidase
VAPLFVDGRYTLQADAQVDGKIFSIEHLVERPPDQWITDNLKSDAKLGYDPWLHTSEQAERLKKACAAAGAELVAVDSNPIDALWQDRPPSPAGAVSLRDPKLAGEAAPDKLKRIRAEITKLRADTLLVTDPQNVAWAFNIRGADVAHTPLALAFAVIPKDGRPALYVDGAKLNNTVRHAVEAFADVRAPDELARDLEKLQGKTVRVDQASAADAFTQILSRHGGMPQRGADPITLLKAIKNHAEIVGSRSAHRRDGAAVTRFLAWLDKETRGGKLTEIDVVAALESFRRDTGALKDISFPTIAGAGPGAIVHYRVTKASNRRIAPEAAARRFRRAIRGRNDRHHARSSSASRATRCATASPACSRAISLLLPRSFPRARAAPNSTRWRARRSGRPASISITGPATASAATCRCTKARHGFPSSAAWRSSAA